MKYFISLLFGLSVLCCCNTGFCKDLSDNTDNTPGNLITGDAIKILSSPELNDLTMNWISEFNRLNPSVNFSVMNIPENQIVRSEGIYIVSHDYSRTPGDDLTWNICLGHEAVVPVFNVNNPMLRDISGQGISIDEFAKLYAGKGKSKWSDVISGGLNEPVRQYILDNTEILAAVSGFTKTDPPALNAILVSKSEDFIASMQKDPYAIGFCKLSDIRKEGRNELSEYIRLLPIDKNGNGRIDNFEDIYNTPDDLSRGVWIGKYPHALCGSIYAFSTTKPTDKNALAFLTWIMTDGGQYLAANGYTDLISMEKQANLAALVNNAGNEATGRSLASWPWLTILALVIVGIIFIIAVTGNLPGLRSVKAEEIITLTPVLNENTVLGPKGLYYDKTHTWAFMEKDGIIRLGVDDFLQHITGAITRVMMKEPGEFVRRGEKILTLIKDGKQLNLYAPVSGTIKAQNTYLCKNSSIINTSPYADGWIYLVEPKNWLREIQFMFMGEKYREWLREEFIRLRNFLKLP